MSIQFLCVSCRQPIEIDDQWAMKVVECPYCHEQVTAPASSTYQPGEPLVARGVAGGPPSAVMSAPAAGPMTPERTRSGNAVAVASLVLSGLSLLLFVVFMGLVGAKLSSVMSPSATPEQQAQAAQQFVLDAAKKGEPWVVTASFLMIGALACWAAGVICGLIGVSKPVRRGYAITGLAAAAIPLVIVLAGMIVR